MCGPLLSFEIGKKMLVVNNRKIFEIKDYIDINYKKISFDLPENISNFIKEFPQGYFFVYDDNYIYDNNYIFLRYIDQKNYNYMMYNRPEFYYRYQNVIDICNKNNIDFKLEFSIETGYEDDTEIMLTIKFKIDNFKFEFYDIIEISFFTTLFEFYLKNKEY